MCSARSREVSSCMGLYVVSRTKPAPVGLVVIGLGLAICAEREVIEKAVVQGIRQEGIRDQGAFKPRFNPIAIITTLPLEHDHALANFKELVVEFICYVHDVGRESRMLCGNGLVVLYLCPLRIL